MRRARLAMAFGAVASFGCIPVGDAPSLGAVEITIVGSAAVLEGIPLTADGWSMTFERNIVIVSNVEFGKTFPPPGGYPYDYCSYRGNSPPISLFSLHTPATLSYRGIEPGPCEGVSFNLANSGEQAAGLSSFPVYAQPGVTADDVSAIGAVNAAALVEGAARRGGQVLRFSFSIALRPNGSFNREFNRCYGSRDGVRVDGVDIPSFNRDAVKLAFHAERLFRSHLPSADHASDDETLEFAAFASADSHGDGDGVVTLSELDQVPLATIRDASGRYDDGGRGKVSSLSDFIRLQFGDVWSFRDDGHCEAAD